MPGGPIHRPQTNGQGKLGSKRHVITDAQGILLIFYVTGANRHDSVVFEQLVDALPMVRGCRGRPRRWQHKLHADKGYNFARCMTTCASWASRRVSPCLASNVMTGSGVIAGGLPVEHLRELALYRHRVFVKMLGWDLAVQDGMGLDQFDRPDTLYVIARGDEGQLLKGS